MKNINLLKLIMCFVSCAFVSCDTSTERNKVDNQSKTPIALSIVEDAIHKAGTLEKWNTIASLEYTKKSRLLLENGDIESEVTQRHQYKLRPNKRITISWVVDKDSFLIVHDDVRSQKFKNDSLIDEGATVQSSVNSALYVLGMPFKLLDKGTVLSYDGLKSINATDTVHAIKATYNPKEHQNHSTQDVWWYHFDKNTSAFLSSMVYHEPTYALIDNVSVIKAEGLTFPKRRKSYRCDSLGNKLFLRAEFWYDDYSIKFLNE